MNNKIIWPIVALAGGFFIGKHWNEIEKFLKPYLKTIGKGSNKAYSSLITFLSQQKEKVDDIIVESKIKKRKAAIATEIKVMPVKEARIKKVNPKVLAPKKEVKVIMPEKVKKEIPETIIPLSTQPVANEKTAQFLKKRIQQITKQHPEGITLQKIGEAVGVHFVRLSGLVKMLMEKNKIRKKENLYFSV